MGKLSVTVKYHIGNLPDEDIVGRKEEWVDLGRTNSNRSKMLKCIVCFIEP